MAEKKSTEPVPGAGPDGGPIPLGGFPNPNKSPTVEEVQAVRKSDTEACRKILLGLLDEIKKAREKVPEGTSGSSGATRSLLGHWISEIGYQTREMGNR